MCAGDRKKQETRHGFLFFLNLFAYLLLCVFLLELLYPSFGINDLLFTGKERMTL